MNLWQNYAGKWLLMQEFQPLLQHRAGTKHRGLLPRHRLFPTQELSVTTFEISMQVPLITLQVYNSPKANHDGILSYLLDFNYSLSLQSQNVKLVWHMIKNSIYNAMDTFISKVGPRWHQFPRWYTPELRHLSKWLHTSKKQFSKHPPLHLQLRMNNPESEYHSKILRA